MDNLTHTLTGLMLSRAGLNKFVPGCSVVMMLAANVPDIDVAYAMWGTPSYLDHHRGWTHGVAAVPGMALLVAGAARLWRGSRFPFLRGWGAAMVAVASHLLLDWTNIYGIRLKAPFSAEWYRLDVASVVDPWIWAVLFAAIAWPALARLVSSEIGAKSKSGPGAAWFALIAIALYLSGRFVLHERAVNVLSSRVYGGEEARQVAAMPDLLNPFRWRGLIELEEVWRVAPVNLLREFDPDAGRTFHKAPSSPAIDAARREEAFRVLGRFSKTAIYRSLPVAEPEGGLEVTATDLRFALPGEGRFEARALVDRNGRVLESGFGFIPRGGVPQPR